MSHAEKKLADARYEEEIKFREDVRADCQAEFSRFKKELPAKIEADLALKFE